MFKIFKELAREPLSGRQEGQPANLSQTSGEEAAPAAPVNSNRLSTPPAQSPALSSQGQGTPIPTEEDDDPEALQVVGLVHALQHDEGLMQFVETFSQLLSMSATSSTRRAFRKRSGFEYLIKALDSLAWKPRPEDITSDEWQVHEVQLAEGQRLWFEVLAWAMDRGGEAHFREHFGYASLLPAVNRLEETSPNPRVFSLLLAHIFDNNYALLSLFKGGGDSIDADALDKAGDVRLRWPAAIPLLWAYVLGPPPSAKGKERAVPQDSAWSGQVEKEASPVQEKLIPLLFRVLLLAAKSTPNLYLIKSYLPDLGDFLITRLYGWGVPRHFDETFPPREEWYSDATADKDAKPEWTAPAPELREVYLSLLRRVLEAGTSTEEAWRLFSLVRKLPAAAKPSTPQPETPDSTNKPFRGKAPLRISIETPVEEETLDEEVLALIQNAMIRRNPDSFVFRSSHNDDWGIEVPDLGKPWPSSTRGFFFSCWVRISKLNEAITLLHLSQKDQPYPLLQIRILENSQIGITTSSYSDTKPPEEVVSGSPEALLPHGEWVHFAAGCRKGRSTAGGGGEARFSINGTRVGAVRVAYPTPKPGLKLEHQKRFEGIRINVGRTPAPEDELAEADTSFARAEENEWLLGRALMLDEVVNEDLVMLMHRLGPRYHGNYQEALGKFLTYENATAINVHLHSMAQAAKQKTLALLPSNSVIVRAVRTGPAISEDSIVFSLNAKDKFEGDHDHVLNAAIPHAARAKDFKFGRGSFHGAVFPFSTVDLDIGISTVGGAVVALKMIDIARTPDELAATLQILNDMTRDCWQTSEEMERIHGFELLAAILRPKMKMLNISSARTLLSILGVDGKNPEDAVVNNTTAYRALGLEFELWALADREVQELYFKHFESLLSTSKHKRYNLLRTFQRSNIVRKLLFAVRSGLYDSDTLPLAVAALKTALVARWSAEDSLKPIFAYLVSALCQNAPPADLAAVAEPSPSQLPAALILKMIAELLTPKRTLKLAKAISLPRLLVIFLQSNQAPFVVLPCLLIVQKCLSTPRLDASFQQKFEAEGGFITLARCVAPLWDDTVQRTVFAMLGAEDTLACPGAMAMILAALDLLLQPQDPTSALATSVNSLTLSSPTADGADAEGSEEYDDRLENLVTKMTVTYRDSSGFRKAFSKRLDRLLPSLVDFATVNACSEGTGSERQRKAIVNFLEALIELSKAPSTVINQMQLCVEQLRAASNGDMSASIGSIRSPPVSATSSPLSRSSSLLQRIGSPRRSSSRRQKPVLKRVLTGESLVEEEKDKNGAWRQIILTTDMQRHSAMILDRKEHWHRVAQIEWPRHVASLRTENGIWADEQEQVKWRLDGSEGPLRMRGRLERIQATHRVDHKRRAKVRDAIPAPDELSSAISRINDAPWDDPFALVQGDSVIEEETGTGSAAGTPTKQAFGSTVKKDAMDSDDDDDAQDVEEDTDDKMRLIAKSLQAGDVIESAHNIVRIVGVDALPGLLILGRRNLYLIDGLVQTADGQVVEADQAPRDVLTIPSGTLADFDPNDQRSHRWPYTEVVEINKRAFLFRDVALELYFQDKQNFLVVFKDKKQRSLVTSRMNAKIDSREGFAKSVLGSLLLDTVANVAKVMDSNAEQLEVFTRRWQNREISNFAYLQMLNQHANRTPNDVTQYPVFPWVVADYDSRVLDLTKPETFRDLSLPMGALSEARRDAAVERYQATEGVGEPPFHYGTHYSSSMIVCGYMIRLSPFTEIFLALQGGTFDLADRLFSSIPRAWDSASRENRGDVRELIPEFYYSPAFLKNTNRLDLGKKQVSGDEVDDVALPPWAMDDPMLFVHWNREALESDYVSRHLPAWIDLTFGYKQRDPSAFNCFHPLSYRGAVDLDAMTDESEKAASTAIIHNFGQTPRQIFKAPHPQRVVGATNPGADRLPVGTKYGVAEHWQLLFRSALPVVESKYHIHHIDPRGNDKPSVQQKHRLVVPEHTNLSVQFGFADDSIRVYCQETGHKLVYIVEGLPVQHAAFASPTLLITVSPLGVVTAWRLTIKGSGSRRGDVQLAREATLRGHDKPVTCITVSAAWNLLVTGTPDGNAMVWDTSQLRYTRTLQTPSSSPVKLASINESNGHVALASEEGLYVYSLNGHAIASMKLESGSRFSGSISFLPREFLTLGDFLAVGIDNGVGLFQVVPGNSAAAAPDGEAKEPWKLVKKGVLSTEEGQVTAVRFIGEVLYAGFEPAPKGESAAVENAGTLPAASHNRHHNHPKYGLYQWTLPEGPVRPVSDNISTCMSSDCSRNFGLLEPRRICAGCGGAFCSTHAVPLESGNVGSGRYCDQCRVQLAIANGLGLLPSAQSSTSTPSGGRSRSGPLADRIRSRSGSLLEGSRWGQPSPLSNH